MTSPSENWVQVDDYEIPDRFRDPRLADFKTVCSNGFEASMEDMSGVFLHKPHRRPECYRNGPDADCTCTIEVLRRVHEKPAEDLTPEGIQLVIPGTERIAPATQEAAGPVLVATYSDHQQRMLDQGRSIEEVRQFRNVTLTQTWTNHNPNTIWNRLAERLGREPTNEEAKAEVLRILREPAP